MRQRHFLYIASLILALLCSATAHAENRGVPFIRNFSAAAYKAHNRSFDVACDDYGRAYFANFECLLYFDGTTWRKIYTPGINRLTRLVNDRQRKHIWFGGFNIFGYLTPDEKGRLKMQPLQSDEKDNYIGEVDMIRVTPKEVYVHVLDGRCYTVMKEMRLKRFNGDASFINLNMTSVSKEWLKGVNVSMLEEGGLQINYANRQRILREEDGLCSNSINFVMYDRHNTVWGATNHGIFAIETPSSFSHLTEGQGLHGEVYTIQGLGKAVYVGTLQGLYCIKEGKVSLVGDFTEACWQLTPDGADALLASTYKGLYRITANGIKRITTNNTLSACPAPGGGYFSAEYEAVRHVSPDGSSHTITDVEKGSSMHINGKYLRVKTINGQLWDITLADPHQKILVRKNIDPNEPRLDYRDARNRRWFTDVEGKNLRVSKIVNGKKDEHRMRPLEHLAISSLYRTKENLIWVGGDFGVICCDLMKLKEESEQKVKEPIYIRQVIADGDSVLWGGFNGKDLLPMAEVKDLTVPSTVRNMTIYYSSRSQSFFSERKYRHRINGGRWSAWTEQTSMHFTNMPYGTNTFEVESIDYFGDKSLSASVEVFVEYPFYLQWWAIIIYVVMLIMGVRAFTMWKEKKLLKAKQQLEATVKQRTKELSNTLYELERTQKDLVRMERTATAGKLTEGLIDRILNPLNYINNFSKLTAGLAKDLKEDIEDEKENMTEDGYDDCADILNMMTQNLTKIEEHGVNTTRTLRAMEAILHTKVGTLRQTDVADLCRKVVAMLKEYNKAAIADCGITFNVNIPEQPVMHDIDPESIKDVLLALATNAFHAVQKKYQRSAYPAEVTLALETTDKDLAITIHDNGIGIEESIMEKVFDPFFTTKTTGEAAGVGLYLARDIIQAHGGTITITSEKDNWTTVNITL